MLQEKKFTIANFNCTFGDCNVPFMDKFTDIVYPALNCGYKRIEKENKYFFYDVKLVEINKEKDLALVGLLVKDTKIEINSIFTNEMLIPTKESYQSSPYSAFVILLKNHRMLYMKNQKGSPQLSVFESTFRACLTNYIYKNNFHNINDLLPNINVVNLPSKLKVNELLDEVEKIKELKIRFYPLNGDIPNNKLFNSLRDDIMTASGSRSANLSINNPREKEVVVGIVEGAEGTAATSMRVKYKNGNDGTIKNESFTEEFAISLGDELPVEIISKLMGDKVAGRKEFYECSYENEQIYSRNIENLYIRYGGRIYEFTSRA